MIIVMKHIKAIGIKFIYVTIVIASIFGILHHASIAMLISMSVVVTGATYLFGDLFLLPRFGTIIASIADFGFVFLLLWGLDNLFVNATMAMFLFSLAGAFFITSCEPLFHAYMEEKVLQTRREIWPPNNLQTEFSEELDKQTLLRKKNKKDKLD